jgi:phenylpropionate dioxygenase-like ring-hydroxylating dioxygenase large terminal subunit
MGSQLQNLKSLVDLENGLISREVFVNEEIYQLEQERVFARAWLFVGHESLIPNPGDYFVSCMGEESVILTRDRQSKIHIFLNTCRHRGMKVCRYDQGNTSFFTCPFHGWSYDTDGKLVGVPVDYKDAYQEKLDKSRWGLIEVPQLADYKGSIWASWDKDAPSFDEWVGDFKFYLDLLFDSYDGKEGGALKTHVENIPASTAEKKFTVPTGKQVVDEYIRLEAP